jgi:hypothetical protein
MAAPHERGEGPIQRQPSGEAAPGPESPATRRAYRGEAESRAELDERAGGTRLRLLPGQHVHFALETKLPRRAKRGTADVWRVVEHTAGRITGGVTIVVQAK